MTLDDFFGDTEAAWKRKLEKEEAARKQAEADERRRKIEEIKARKGKGKKPALDPVPTPADAAAPVVTSLADYVKLENIQCVDADGTVFEKYNTIYVRKDVEKDAAGKRLMVTPYSAIKHCESFGFLPSAALMANIHVAIYRAAVERQADGTYRTKDAKMEAMLKKLRYRGDGIGGHWVNTLVDWKGNEIIHYPQDGDFPTDGGTAGINSAYSRKNMNFDKANFSDTTLKEALKIPNYRRFVQNYSGLPDPAVLIDVAKYYGKTARVWVSSSQETRAAWFGCILDYFYLLSNNDLSNTNAVRGVRERAP